LRAGTGPFGLEPFGHGPDLVEQGGHAGHELVDSAEQLFTYTFVTGGHGKGMP
jgi:hypothetical protein